MSVAMDEFPRRHRITVEEYYRMAEVGLLEPDARVELIEGEIIEMPPMGSRHAAVVRQLQTLLTDAVGKRALVQTQLPVRLDNYSEPQPDLALVAFREDFYREKHPAPADTLLAIEVSESTLRFDRTVKAALYARHGIPELWIIDTRGKQLHVSRNPIPTGYAETLTTDRPTSMQLIALAGITIDLLPLLSGL
jgi:Uma2 family endonuclease